MKISGQVLLFILTILVSRGGAQVLNNTGDHITIEDGLPDNHVRDIIQDRAGFMWFATANGVARFDGYTFTVFQCHPFDPHSLSACSTQRIYEDRQGQLWVTTVNYLNRFDPVLQRFIRYSGLEKFGRINVIYQAKSGAYFLGFDTTGVAIVDNFQSLNSFASGNAVQPSLRHFRHSPGDHRSLASDAIWDFYEDRSGHIWIATQGGLNRLENYGAAEEPDLIRYQHDAADPSSLSHNLVTSIVQDSIGNLWVGTNDGLNLLRQPATSVDFERYYQHGVDERSMGHNQIRSLHVDSRQNLWVGTSAGLDKFTFRQPLSADVELPEPTSYLFQWSGKAVNLRNFVSLHEDDSGILWLASATDGAYKLNQKKRKFATQTYPFRIQSNPGMSSITAIYEEEDGTLFLGTLRGALLKTEPWESSPRARITTDHSSFELNAGRINAIAQDMESTLWIGTARGLRRIHRQTGELLSFETQLIEAMGSVEVFDISRDSQGILWFGTDRGLFTFDELSQWLERFLPKTADPNALTWPQVWSVFEDTRGFIWVATKMGGISRLDRETGHFINHAYNSVNSIYEAGDGTMWFGSYSGGLAKLLGIGEQRFDLKHYLKEHGLPTNQIRAILGDKDDQLWLSTARGLSRLDPKTEQFRNFTMNDGLQAMEFNRGAFTKTTNEQILFGGTNSLTGLDPRQILDNPHRPKVALTSFTILDKDVQFDQPLSDVRAIDLSYRDSFISFGFAALEYTSSEENQYAYMLEGFSDDWVYSGQQRTATFTKLEPGEYVFRVKASNSDGVWNEEGIAVAISVAPPWWQTPAARIATAILIITTVLAIHRRRVTSIEKQKRHLEVVVAERTRELGKQTIVAEQARRTIELQSAKLVKADRMKSRFFANISHEFRTPLSLIIGPLKEMINRNGSNGHKANNYGNGDGKYLDIMYLNAERLLKLINQLLEIAKLESGDMKLNLQMHDIVVFSRKICDSFLSAAESKHINFEFLAPPSPLTTAFDADKLTQVLYNLLSNAFKFTPERGCITVGIARYADHAELSVEDTGIGIADNQKPFIFDRFYQVDDSSTRSYTGTGLGLSLSKDLIELHGGSLKVAGSPCGGSKFTARLPLGQSCPGSGNEASHVERNSLTDTSRSRDSSNCASNKLEILPVPASKANMPEYGRSPILVILEDNEEILNYLVDQLTPGYSIVTAANGHTGLAKVRQVIPDLVISDVMMPLKNGYDLCRELKEDEKTCHIPVILLTAKASLESKVEGLKLGADAYISKPFDMSELKVTVQSLLLQREKLREKFSRQLLLQPQNISVQSLDEAFLKKIRDLVEENLSDPELASKPIENEFNMTKRQFQRKMRALLNQTPTQFIRYMRLERAKQLIESRAGSISEICFQTGFNNLSYFASSFRKQFGILPSELVSNSNET